MPRETYVVKKTPTGVYLISALLAAGGVGLIIWALRGQDPFGDIRPEPGHDFSDLKSPLLEGPEQLTIRIGQTIAATQPTVKYQGPGIDTFSHFQIKQLQGGEWVSVYGSGVAGVHVGPASIPTSYYLVSPQEVQPAGCPQQSLCAAPWGTTTPFFPPGYGICGAPPMPGPATALLEIYLRRDPADADGFASPTCNPRVAVARRVYPNKIMFMV